MCSNAKHTTINGNVSDSLVRSELLHAPYDTESV